MALSFKHTFQSAVSDGGDTSLVRPSDWNAEHSLSMATAKLLGRTTAGTGSPEEITVGGGLTFSSTSLSLTAAAGLLDLSNASSGQIKFPATQNASSNANTLDDYEEGTWTPAWLFGGGSTGITYTTQSGWYTKIGNQATIQWNTVFSSKGSSTGSACMSGVPFAAATACGMGGGYFDHCTGSFQTALALNPPGNGYIEVYKDVAGNNMSDADFQNGSHTRCTFVIIV